MRHKKDPPFALHFFLSPAFFNTSFRLGVGVHEKIEEMVGRSGSPALYGDYLVVYPTFSCGGLDFAYVFEDKLAEINTGYRFPGF